MDRPEALLRDLFDAAVRAASPAVCLPPVLPDPPSGRTVVLGAGKAAAAMARVVERAWSGPLDGLVVTRYGHAVPTDRIEVVEAGHPLPDGAGLEAARRMLEWAEHLSGDDLALCLISGGGSSLLALPPPSVDLSVKRALTDRLLRSGATIGDINCVRKHLSAIKGGRLARACHPAAVVTVAISDVVGDDPAVIASGPTVGDASTSEEALQILDRFKITPPDTVRAFLRSDESETPDGTETSFARDRFSVAANCAVAIEAAGRCARERGLDVLMLGDRIEGEARAVAESMAALARRIRRERSPVAPPCIVLSGGETTVTVRGSGRGGPNTEFQLALALALNGEPGVWSLAADTDGIDGGGDNAGAIAGPQTIPMARAAGLDPDAALADNDAYRVFAGIGNLVMTGPTRTNVNDFRAMLIESDP